MFKSLYLLRHGRTQANVERRFVGQSDSDLADLAYPTIESIAEELRKVHFDFFYISPIGRCQKSFQLLGLTNIDSVVTEARLRESDNGDYEGFLPSELPADFVRRLIRSPYITVFPGGESYEIMDRRVLEFWNEQMPKWEGKTVGILSHWGPNSCIAAQIMGWDWERRGRWYQPNNIVYKIEDGKMSFRPFGECGWYEGLSVTRR